MLATRGEIAGKDETTFENLVLVEKARRATGATDRSSMAVGLSEICQKIHLSCESYLSLPSSQMVNKSAVYTFQQYLSLLYIASVKLELAAETRFATIALFRRFWECKGWSTAADSPPPPASAVCDPEGGEVGYFVAACVFLACKAEEQFRKLRDGECLSRYRDIDHRRRG